jgi:hypothetical protein
MEYLASVGVRSYYIGHAIRIPLASFYGTHGNIGGDSILSRNHVAIQIIYLTDHIIHVVIVMLPSEYL